MAAQPYLLCKYLPDFLCTDNAQERGNLPTTSSFPGSGTDGGCGIVWRQLIGALDSSTVRCSHGSLQKRIGSAIHPILEPLPHAGQDLAMRFARSQIIPLIGIEDQIEEFFFWHQLVPPTLRHEAAVPRPRVCAS